MEAASNGEVKLNILQNKFAFSKSKRFSPPRPYNQQISYEPKLSDFDKAARQHPRKTAIGGNQQRFDYYSSRRKQGTLPSPQSYNSAAIATNKGGKSFLNAHNRGYSFGTSRFPPQAILKPWPLKDLEVPGPGTHEQEFTWVTPKDNLLNKTSPQYSFARIATKGDHFERQNRKMGLQPGPGHYSSTIEIASSQEISHRSPRQSIIGNLALLDTQSSGAIHSVLSRSSKQAIFNNTAMARIGKSLASTIRSDAGNSFSKANDRFYAPTQKKQSPSPNAYRLGDSIGYDDQKRNSPFKTKQMLRTSFGRENRSTKFDQKLVDEDLVDRPGPGSYAHFTSFNNESKFARSILHQKLQIATSKPAQ